MANCDEEGFGELTECPECNHLLAEHARLMRVHAVAIERIGDSEDRSLPFAEYRRIGAMANAAWQDAEYARRKVERHRLVHIVAK
jgi:hypothetical protein